MYIALPNILGYNNILRDGKVIEVIDSYEERKTIIKTNEEHWPEYIRNNLGEWFNLRGKSWEPCFGKTEEELEQAYQKFIKGKRNDTNN